MAPSRARPGAAHVKVPSPDPKLDLPPSRPIPPPAQRQKSFAGGAVAAAGAAAVGASAASAASKQPLLAEEEGDGEESEEEESEEAPMCWSVLFTFLPVILEIVTEFGSAAYEAVRRARMQMTALSRRLPCRSHARKTVVRASCTEPRDSSLPA